MITGLQLGASMRATRSANLLADRVASARGPAAGASDHRLRGSPFLGGASRLCTQTARQFGAPGVAQQLAIAAAAAAACSHCRTVPQCAGVELND